MFRMPPQIHSQEERKRINANVRANFIIFGVVCAAIRLAPFILKKVNA